MSQDLFRDSPIFPHLAGKVIKDVGKDGSRFYIQTFDPLNPDTEELYHIEWINGNGETVKGEPKLVHRKDVRVTVVGAGVTLGGKI